ncbi:MAG: trehalose-6-phosphate synthase [Candidatus Eisenbacteria bacterium]|nr:trehalose-6-phosphate synthase [Candidatus Eisenbacteria bacterium]
MSPKDVRLLVVSNRLPIKLEQSGDSWTVKSASGGLVTALAPVLRDRGGLWIGWPGVAGELDLGDTLTTASSDVGYQLKPVMMTEEELNHFYYGFANEIVWPLFHDLLTNCNFVPEYWHTYLDVNRKYAQAVADASSERDYIWVHDYHLMHVAKSLRALGLKRRIGFFLHIPFPPIDIFLKLPWRAQILRALLEYDLVGFQTLRDRRNFVQCLQHLSRGTRVRGRGPVVTARHGERDVRLGAFPIGIDFDGFSERAASREVSDRGWYLHEALPNRQIILSVDRLDYTKGIPERLEGFRRALVRYPELHEKVTLVQIVVPSREEVPRYRELRDRIERLISEINGAFTRPGWVPIHYLYRSLERDGLIAHYRVAEIGLITPLKDGMNLVAKEYCSCDVEEKGALILSEFAGAAPQLHRGALMVNPLDYEGVADAIQRAFLMRPPERRARMRKMRDVIKRTSVFWWVDSFLDAAFARHLEDFPPQAAGGMSEFNYEERDAYGG